MNGFFLKFCHSPIFNFAYSYSIFCSISGRLRHLPGLFPRRRRDELQHLPGEKPLFFPKKRKENLFILFFFQSCARMRSTSTPLRAGGSCGTRGSRSRGARSRWSWWTRAASSADSTSNNHVALGQNKICISRTHQPRLLMTPKL